ncbi:MAG TPA: hypothetical protein VMW52_05615, partial [Phycisphaerae bacterium]|nr:hypothetical protein [Phycisphaerae bacterium]
MAKRNIDILIRAKDQASRQFGKVGNAADGLRRTMVRVGAAVGMYFSGRAVKQFLGGSLEAFGRQEKAVKTLGDTLALIGPEAAAQIGDLQKFASGIQRITTMGDEAVLELAALAAGLGRLSGKALKDATVAAIGLSRRLGIDTTAAMRLVARAAVGDTAMLARYGVKLDQTLSPQEKFNELLRMGAESFSIATGETATYIGRITQLKNAWGDVKEGVGGAIAKNELVMKSLEDLTWGFKNLDVNMAITAAQFDLFGSRIAASAKQLFTKELPHLFNYMGDYFGAVLEAMSDGMVDLFTGK